MTLTFFYPCAAIPSGLNTYALGVSGLLSHRRHFLHILHHVRRSTVLILSHGPTGTTFPKVPRTRAARTTATGGP